VNREEFNRFRDAEYDRIVKINEEKGHDYAGEADVLSNFREAAVRLAIPQEKVWAVYADKHWQAVMTFCREGQVASEPIEGRLHDVILYCFLLLGLLEDKNQAEAKAANPMRGVAAGSSRAAGDLHVERRDPA